MLNKKRDLLLLLLLPLLALAQLRGKIDSDDDIAKPLFYYDVVTYPLVSRDSVEVEVRSKVPFDVIQFLHFEDHFQAKYELSILVTDEDDGIAFSKIWTQTLKTKSFAETNARQRFDVNHIRFKLLPAKYKMTIGVLDLDTRKSKYYTRPVDSEEIYSKPISLSKLTLIEQVIQEADGSQRRVPSIENAISDVQPTFHIAFDVLSEGGQAKIEYMIYDREKKLVYRDKMEKELEPGISHQMIEISKDELGFSRYRLVLYVKIGRHEVSSERVFQVRWLGMSSMIRDLEMAVEQLKYITGSKEVKEMKKGSQDEKKQKFLEFWKAKDPTPETEENELMNEYYRRVYFADENFSGFQPGWRSDMGMIFILFGPPNDIERHPFDMESKPYEVWYYYELNRTFVFVDESGFGEYRLITPLTDYHGKY